MLSGQLDADARPSLSINGVFRVLLHTIRRDGDGDTAVRILRESHYDTASGG